MDDISIVVILYYVSIFKLCFSFFHLPTTLKKKTGINPRETRGSNMAVYTASCLSDSESIGCDEKLTTKYWLLAHVRALLANRISYVLNLKGKLDWWF